MTFLFLLYAILVAWLTYNLYYPVTRPGGASVISFLSGWLIGELAWHHIAIQAAVTFLFVWAGAAEGLFGAVAMSMLVASWLAMSHFYTNGHRAEDVVEYSLAGALGDNYRDVVHAEVRATFAEQPDSSRLLRPLTRISKAHPSVEVIKNISFGNFGQKLDVYRARHVSNTVPSPVLMQIHGGAWTENMGSKNEQALPLMTHMAKRGWVAVSVDYRLSPTATWPEHLIDCKEGLKWIKEHVAEYGGDPDFIVVTGGSAGGHLTAMMALTAGDPEYQPGFEDFDSTVQAAVPFYGPMDFNADFPPHQKTDLDFLEATILKKKRQDDPDVFNRASPINRIHDGAPPFFVIHGDRDSLVPVEGAREFVQKLREVSKQPVAYAEIEGAQHAFDMFPSVRSEHVKHGVERFLAWTHAGHRAARLQQPKQAEA